MKNGSGLERDTRGSRSSMRAGDSAKLLFRLQHPGCGELLQHCLSIKETSPPARDSSSPSQFTCRATTSCTLSTRHHRHLHRCRTSFRYRLCTFVARNRLATAPNPTRETIKTTRHARGLNRTFTNAHHHSREPALPHHRHEAISSAAGPDRSQCAPVRLPVHDKGARGR